MFKRIQVNPDEFNGEPTIRDTGVLLSDILKALADGDKADVYRQFPQLEVDDLREALLYSADLIAAAALEDEPETDPDLTAAQIIHQQNQRHIDLAMLHPETTPAYSLQDGATEEELMQVTTFQLEWLKANSQPPLTPEEGWYFGKRQVARAKQGITHLDKEIETLDDHLDAIDELRTEQGDEMVDMDELARMSVKADLLDTKREELDQLRQVMATQLNVYDAIEFTWKPL